MILWGKQKHIMIERYVALEDKSRILKKAIVIRKKLKRYVLFVLSLFAKIITSGILKAKVVANTFLLPYRPTNLQLSSSE